MNRTNTPKHTAVICAAGKGDRLMPLTADRPKTLVSVGEKSMLEYLLDNLSQVGLTDVVIVVGYRGDVIEKTIGPTYRDCAITYVRNKDYEITDNYYSMYLARNHVPGGMIFFNADIIFSPNVLTDLLTSKHENSLAAVSVFSPGAGKNPVRLHIDSQGKIVDIGHDIGEQYRDMVFGIYKLSPEATKSYFASAEAFFADGPKRGGFWFPIKEAVVNNPFSAVPVDGTRWASVNTIDELENAKKLLPRIYAS